MPGSLIKALFAAILASAIITSGPRAEAIIVKAGDNLQDAIDRAEDGDTLLIAEGRFSAVRHYFVDSLCGNCPEQRTDVSASYGFIIKNKSLHLIGQSRLHTVLCTNAGYGLFIDHSPRTSLQDLTITEGRRDPDGNATDAAVVVRRSRIYLHRLNIIDNIHRLDSLVVGIGGVFGREGAELTITDCDIINNGWDGIALYRGASAFVSDCLIKDGRGAGIGVTWDASCTAYRNIITGYWKGIGAFGTSWVIARNNAVYDNLGWGMIATGQSFMDMANNVVYHNGNCGVAVWSTECRGRMVNNIITANGWRKEWVCPCVGVWNYGDWSGWEFSHNIVCDNKEGNYRDIWDQTEINGNLAVDPQFRGLSIFLLSSESPAHNTGHPEISNPDGTRSDIGLSGGPQARNF